MFDSLNNYPWANLPAGSPAFYDQFFGPLFFEPYAIEVAKRIDPVHVKLALEMAAGTGRVTKHIRERIPAAARLVTSDIDDAMLAGAKKGLGHLAIEWQHIDAQQIPFADNSVDLLVCCFGYMFVTDKPKAFAEAFRVLRPGGMLVFTTWDSLEENPISFIASSIAKEYVEESLPASANLATSMCDEAAIEMLLRDAGFSKTVIEKTRALAVSPSAKQASFGLVKGSPYYAVIAKQDPEHIAEINLRVEKELGHRFGEVPMTAPISALISRAWK